MTQPENSHRDESYRIVIRSHCSSRLATSAEKQWLGCRAYGHTANPIFIRDYDAKPMLSATSRKLRQLPYEAWNKPQRHRPDVRALIARGSSKPDRRPPISWDDVAGDNQEWLNRPDLTLHGNTDERRENRPPVPPVCHRQRQRWKPISTVG